MTPAAALPSRATRARLILALLCLTALAFVLRTLGLHWVFLDDGGVVFELGDALYHVHRARFSLHHFPDFLTFDPCLNYPHGASVPYPPLPDLLVAGTALLFGGSVAAFERVAAWSPAVLGSLAILPAYALGRRIHGPGVGLGAAALLAMAPVPIIYSRVGYPDHHAAVGLLGALLVAGYAAALDERVSGRRLHWTILGLTLTRAALLLTWQGGLLYVGIGELALVASACLGGRRDRALPLALGAAGVAVLIAPFVTASATPLAGPYSASELSRLHVLVFVAEALVALGAWLWERTYPAADFRLRLLRLLGLGAGVGIATLVIPDFVDGIRPAFDFLAQRDEVGASIPEQAPLLASGDRRGLSLGIRRMGLFLFLIPLVPVVFLQLGSRSAPLSAVGRYLFLWSLVTGVLAMQQIRYANDFGVVGCVGFALLMARVAEALERSAGLGRRVAVGAAVVLAAIAQAPALVATAGPYLGDSWRFLRGELPEADRALETVNGTQLRFAEEVRRVTPDGPGCDGSSDRPEYAVLSPFSLGHAMHYVAERATPASNFGPYIGEENFHAVQAFFNAPDEAAALSAVEALGVSYVITEEEGESLLSPVGRRLHHEDGRQTRNEVRWERFRLVSEGPAGGLPSAAAYGVAYREGPPFKLFEVVKGAVIEVPVAAGGEALAVVVIGTPAGRRFQYLATGTADDHGVARLRVPYPTMTPRVGPTGEPGTPVRALSRYRVRADGRVWQVDVTEAQVRQGDRIRLEPGRGTQPSPSPEGASSQ